MPLVASKIVAVTKGRTTRYKTAAKTAPINSATMYTKNYHLGREL